MQNLANLQKKLQTSYKMYYAKELITCIQQQDGSISEFKNLFKKIQTFLSQYRISV